MNKMLKMLAIKKIKGADPTCDGICGEVYKIAKGNNLPVLASYIIVDKDTEHSANFEYYCYPWHGEVFPIPKSIQRIEKAYEYDEDIDYVCTGFIYLCPILGKVVNRKLLSEVVFDGDAYINCINANWGIIAPVVGAKWLKNMLERYRRRAESMIYQPCVLKDIPQNDCDNDDEEEAAE